MVTTTTPTLNRQARRYLAKMGRAAPGAANHAEAVMADITAVLDEWQGYEEWVAELPETNDAGMDSTGQLGATLTGLVQDGTSLTEALGIVAGDDQTNYPGLYPSHHQLLLDRGRLWRSSDATLYRDINPEGVDSLPGDGLCYENAYQVAKRHNLKYVEGVALVEIVPEGYDKAERVVAYHAFCYDPATGGIIEPFWPWPASEYLGIIYQAEQVEEAIYRSAYYGIMPTDYLRGFDLLTRGILGIDYVSKEEPEEVI